MRHTPLHSHEREPPLGLHAFLLAVLLHRPSHHALPLSALCLRLLHRSVEHAGGQQAQRVLCYLRVAREHPQRPEHNRHPAGFPQSLPPSLARHSLCHAHQRPASPLLHPLSPPKALHPCQDRTDCHT
eukprot:2111604-Rhodomonas_salina.7